MKWSHGSSILRLLLLLMLGVSCTTGDGTPTEISLTEGAALEGPSVEPLMIELVVCEAQRYEKSSKTIGREGGSLKIGRHRLEIPRGALASRVTITGEQVIGPVNSVRLSPEGLRFAKPARLTLDYRNCLSIPQEKRVAYTDELLRILELPSSEDYPDYEYVTAEIDHFSRYAVAY
jgi:hypothetical protein